jgi:hypothetical protein
MLGGSADGRGSSGAIPEFAGVAADAASGMPLAVPATATLVRNLRRSTPPRDSLVRRFFMSFLSSCLRRRQPARRLNGVKTRASYRGVRMVERECHKLGCGDSPVRTRFIRNSFAAPRHRWAVGKRWTLSQN